MKTISFENPEISTDSLTYVIDYLLEFSSGDIISTKAGKWMSMYYSVLIITEQDIPIKTDYFIQDLLRITLMDRRKKKFKILSHSIHNSIEYKYCGTTVLHNTMDDAIDYANYMLIRINN